MVRTEGFTSTSDPQSKWNITPIIGDNDRAKLENWYYAVWAYNGFVSGSTYPGTVLNWIANCPNGQWDSVTLTPPTSAQIASMRTIPNTPAPVHIDANFDGIIDSSGGGGSAGMAVPQESQNDGRWKNDKLGPGPDTVGKLGCVVTDVAMVLEYYGTSTNPQELNNWLRGQTNPPGYDSQENLYWATAALHGKGVSYKGSYDWTNVAANLDIINSELDAGYPVIAHVSLWGSSHYVVITGHSGSSTYYVNDPWDGQKYTIPNSRYGASPSPSVVILGINMYHGQHGTADTTPPIVTITSGQTNGGTYNSPQRVTWHIDDGTGSGIDRWGQGWDQDPGANPYTTSDGYLDLPVGTHTLHVHVRDKAGNEKDWTFGPYIYAQPLQVGQGSGGNIDQRYVDCYNRVGPSIVGSVNSYVHSTIGSFGNGGAQDFSGGAGGQGIIMAKDGAAQAFNTRGDIWKVYSASGYANSPLGFPTSDEQDGNPSPQGTAGRVSHFESGVITSTASGTYKVYGDMFDKYVTAGGSGGALGFPNGDVVVNPGSIGRYGTSGYIQMFEGGGIFSSHFGTFEVHGTTWSNYALKIIAGLFGFPVSDEQSATPSPYGTTGSVVHFENGVVCNTAKYGVHGVSGTIFQKYVTAAGSGGIYGFPTSEAYDWNGGTRQNFEGGYLTTGITTHTHMLWNNTDGRVMLWSVDGAGNVTLNGFGPYTDGASQNKWSATAVATGPDGKSHLLWNNTDGRVMLWTVDDAGSFTLAGYGPYTDGASQNMWSATAVSVGPDNVVHLLWNNTDNRVMLWNVNPDFTFTLAGFGPDNVSRIAWNNTDYRVMLWKVDSAFNFTLAGYGPYTDGSPGNLWSAAGVSVGPDNLTHLLWSNTDRRAMFWNVDNSFNFTLAGFGPYTDNAPGNLWYAGAVATGPDGLNHVLWDNTDYRAMLWGLDNSFGFTVAGYGPYTDNAPGNLWSATAISAGP